MSKRFKLFTGNNYGVQSVDGEVIFDSIISMAEADVLVDLLNDLSEEYEQLKLLSDAVREELGLANRDNTALEKENGQLEEDLDYYKAKCGSLEVGMFNLEREYDKLKSENIDLRKDLGEFEKSINIQGLIGENEQLKQRNNRQAKQLDRLYNLIEEKDWRTLTDILDDFKRCEEQLQKEWGTYGDVE